MKLFKLAPVCKDYVWGGVKLKTNYGKKTDLERAAESWELSCHPDGESVITNGKYAGKTLASVVREEGDKILGAANRGASAFPILIKLIDAKENLSVQVHPDDAYAEKYEGQPGKTEMWLILEAEEGASLYYGVKRATTVEELTARLKDGSVTEILNKAEPKKGDVFFIEPGTIHAIGKGLVIAEVQQSSNVTYRLYDYGRPGADGALRELHVEKGAALSNLTPSSPRAPREGFLASCKYFSARKLVVNAKFEGFVGGESFQSLLVLEGSGRLETSGERMDFVKGDSIFIAANSGAYKIYGNCEILETTTGENQK
jgi:mannose-6-phosphate isomerase